MVARPLLVFVLFTSLVGPALADTFEWIDPVTGNFKDDANWKNITGVADPPPNVGDQLRFNEAGAYTVKFEQDEASDELAVTDGAVAFLSDSSLLRTFTIATGQRDGNISGGTLTVGSAANPVFLNLNSTSSGSILNVGSTAGDGSLFVKGSQSRVDALGTGSHNVGRNGSTGMLTLQSGATANYGGTLRLGVSNGSDGQVTVDGGSMLNTNHIAIASDTSTAIGSMTVTASSSSVNQTTTGAALTIGSISGGAGDLNVESGGTFTTGTGATTISATGALNITDGTFHANGPLSMTAGSALILDDGVLNANAGLDNSAGGTLNLLDGTLRITGGAFVQPNGAGAPTFLSIDGPTFFETPRLVIGTGATTSIVDALIVGNAERGELSIVGSGTVFNNRAIVGGGLDSNGSVSVSGGATWENTSSLRVGESGSGILIISGDSTVSNTTGDIGNFSTSVGDVRVRDTGTTWSNSDDLAVGRSGVGFLFITEGGMVSSPVGAIGRASGSEGTVIIDGAGSTWMNSSDLFVGGSPFSAGGTGILDVENSGLLHVGDMLKIWDEGTVNLSGGTISLSDDTSLPATDGSFEFGAGVLEFRNDTAITSALTSRAHGGSAIGFGRELRVLGEATMFTGVSISGGTLTVGSLKAASLVQLDSGTLHLTNQAIMIELGGPLGDILDLNPNITVTVDLGLTNNGLVTGDGTIGGTFTNNTAGEVQGIAGNNLVFTGSGNTNNGLMTLSGGQLHFAQDLVNGSTGLVIGNGTLRADGGVTNDGNMAFSATANVIGDVTNNASGLITSSGGTTSYFDDVVNSGEVRTNDDSFSVYFGSYSGNGDTGTGTVIMNGDLKPGSSPGTMEFGGSLSFSPAASLEIEIEGLLAGSEYDQILIAGNVTLDGMLDVSLINPFTLIPGQSFEIIDVGVSSTGIFNGLAEGGLVGNYGGINLLITYLGGDGNDVTLLSALPGDFDIDGDIDGLDFLKWQRGESPDPLSATNLADWETHYGMVAPLSATSAVVPEPATGILLMLGMVVILTGSRMVVSKLISA